MGCIFEIVAGGQVTRIASAYGDKYVMPDGSGLMLDRTAGWCVTCARFRAVEAFDALAQYDAWIAEAEPFVGKPGLIANQRADPSEQHRLEWHVRTLPELRRRRAWRAARRSPPRCLTCGATDITPLKMNEAVNVPGVGQAKLNVLMADVSGPTADYSPEGERVRPARKIGSPAEAGR